MASKPYDKIITKDNVTLVCVPESVLDLLKESNRILGALEEFGVDNWEGYGEALRSLNEDEE